MFLVVSKVDVLFTNTTCSSSEIYDHHIYKTIGLDNGRYYWTYLHHVMKCNYWYEFNSFAPLHVPLPEAYLSEFDRIRIDKYTLRLILSLYKSV